MARLWMRLQSALCKMTGTLPGMNQNRGCHDHALSLRRGALVPAAVDAGRTGPNLRSKNAAVSAARIRQGISRTQSARHHSTHDRWRNQNDGVLGNLSLS